MTSLKQSLARRVLAFFFIVAGVNHFLAPEIYLGMMPAWLPLKAAANVISGTAETTDGIGLFIPRVRRAAAWGLIALPIVVFPANIHVSHQGHMPGLENAPPSLLWLRLALQPVFIAWVGWTTRAAATGKSLCPAAPDQLATARREGWIHIPPAHVWPV